YSSQFRNYSGETFKVVRVQKTTRPTDFIVTTHILRPNGERIFKIAFQVHRRAGKPNKILDVKIEGVSMILTQRDEFIAYISQQDGRVQALIDVLNKRIAKLKSKGLEPTNDTAGEPATSPSAEKPAEVPEPKKEPSSDEKEDEEEQDQG
ncbi:MAG TPA: hypothetical protein DCE33_03525, partial [Rhodospirillaceae bacterium]|nr:hypothetical protein [Rhodospirillaceae bacterium]